jgi:hypothetical protein
VRRAHERLFVLVDATTGAIALQFDMHAEARNRKVCDANSTASMTCTVANTKRVEGGAAVPNDADVNNAYDYSGATYDYFFERFGRDGINNAGMLMQSVVRLCPKGEKCPWDNAAWTGSQMVYGAGLASADDVVAHELAHGVTQYESNLYYWFQSGAINESLSDVFGELIDQAYVGNTTDTDEVRWKLGEDLPSEIGVIRDMKNPNDFDQPDDMADAKYFSGVHPTQGYVVDNGGVHYNSGVNNKAAQLLVDGGTHNTVAVAPIGATKTARLYYDVHDRLTSAADYNDLYWALKATCSALATAGTDGFTATDCTAVNNALAAVKMSQEPPVAKTAPAGTCNTGASLVQTVLTENFDAPLSSAWTRGVIVGGNKWFGPAASSYGGPYATSGTGAIRGYNDDVRSDSWMGRTAGLTVPAAGANTPYLRFNSSWSFERSSGANFDGGIIEVSANGGAWTDVATLGLPVSRGYNGTITTAAGFDNPLRGRKAFVGTSNGYTATRIDLTKVAGKSLRFRFRVATDSDVADEGWFIDDLKVYTCTYGPTGVAIAVSPARSFYGTSASFHGRLLKAGTTTGVGGQRLVLQYRVPGATTWTNKAYATTARTGTVGMATYTFKPTRTYEYRYLFPSSGGWRGSASVTRTHVVVPVVASKLSPTSMRLGSTALLSGTVTPTHAGKTVSLQRLVNGAWGTISTRALSSTSTYAFGIRPATRGTHSYRVLFTGDADHGAAASTTRVLTVS